MKLHTSVQFRLNGRLHWQGQNYVVAEGRKLLAALISQGSNAPASHMALGTSGVSTQDSMTALQGVEVQRVGLVLTLPGASNTLTHTGSFGGAIVGSHLIQEAGIFNAAVAGVMLARVRPSPFTIGPGDDLDVIWDLRLGDEA